MPFLRIQRQAKMSIKLLGGGGGGSCLFFTLPASTLFITKLINSSSLHSHIHDHTRNKVVWFRYHHVFLSGLTENSLLQESVFTCIWIHTLVHHVNKTCRWTYLVVNFWSWNCYFIIFIWKFFLPYNSDCMPAGMAFRCFFSISFMLLIMLMLYVCDIM